MSDDTSNDSGSNQQQNQQWGSPLSLRTLIRAARWETFALLAVLLVIVFAFS